MRRCGIALSALTVLLAPVAGCAATGSTEPSAGRAAPITVDAAPVDTEPPADTEPAGVPLRNGTPHAPFPLADSADYLATLTNAGVRPRTWTAAEQAAARTAGTAGQGTRGWSPETWVDLGLAACDRLYDADGDVAAVIRAVRGSLPTAGGYGWADMTAAERSTLIVTTAAEELCPDAAAQ
ncbi:hypothetical protein FHS23_002623 [Prauserella isguenensis]|uniref:DUF732 domain-containing protein n=1 Tax=Prauserella isguenensis TaxID=1470180 RepID=A0A839S2Q8_9PSEU|nr:hypothetical protein [Prauserella isguenensis]